MAFGIGKRIKRAAKKAESQLRGETERVGKRTEKQAQIAGQQFSRTLPIGRAAAKKVRELTPSEEALPGAPEATPIPIPDEELSRIARRRSRARRRGGRASSILSDSETLG